MAIINCLACGKRVSDKAPHCEHCGAPVAAKDEDAMARALFKQRAIKARRQQYAAFAAVFMFFVGAVLFWMGLSAGPESWQTRLGQVFLGVGFVFYAVVRVLQALHRKSG